MKYLSSAPFSVGQSGKSTACEKCVYGSGVHADWCPERPRKRGFVPMDWEERITGAYEVQRGK